jgi:hypothetical protein
VSSEPGEHDISAAGTGRPGRRERLIGICAYIALFLFGLLQALIGCFQYGRGPAPLAAVGFDLAILATCVLGAQGMRTVLGGLMPGVGWFVAAFVLATGTQGGSVLITNMTAGEWFLFGGSACAAGGCLVSYVRWAKVGLAARQHRQSGR